MNLEINENCSEAKWIININNSPQDFRKESARRSLLDEGWQKYETQLWQLCYNMGASHISAGLASEVYPAGSKFFFPPTATVNQTNSYQIDVFAVIRDYALCISVSTVATRNNLWAKVNEMRGIKRATEDRIDAIFPDANLKKIFIVASNKVSLEPEDMRTIYEGDGIICLRNEELKYIEDIHSKSQLQYFTFNQFLNFFHRDLNEEDFFEVNTSKSFLTESEDAIEEGSTEAYFYTFTIDPNKILPLCSIAHRKAKELYSDQGQTATYYQRLLDGTRVKNIAKFIADEKGLPFVNNILLSWRGDANYELGNLENYFRTTDEGQEYQGSVGKLKLFNSPGMFHVIDGQHRLFSYSPELHPEGITEKEEVVVTIVDGIDIKKESELFVDINKKQKTVSPNLLDEIELIQGEENEKNLSTAVALRLRENSESAFNNPKLINDTDATKNDPKGKFNFSAISKPLSESNISGMGGDWKRGYGVNRNGIADFNSTVERIEKLMNSFFLEIKNSTNGWQIGNRSLDKGIIISAFIKILERMISRDEIAMNTNADIFPEIADVTGFFIEGLNSLDDNQLEILTPKSFLGGQKYNELSSVLIKIIFSKSEDFRRLIDRKDNDAYDQYREKYFSDEVLRETQVELENKIQEQKEEIDALHSEIRALSNPTGERLSQQFVEETTKKNIGRIVQIFEKQIKTYLHIFLENELEEYTHEIREGENSLKEQYSEKLEYIANRSRNRNENTALLKAIKSIKDEQEKLKSELRPLYKYDASYLNPWSIKLLFQGLKDVRIDRVPNFPSQIKDEIHKYFEVSNEDINFDTQPDNSPFYYLQLMNSLRRYEAGHFGVDIPGETIPIRDEEMEHFQILLPRIQEKMESFFREKNISQEIEERERQLENN